MTIIAILVSTADSKVHYVGDPTLIDETLTKVLQGS
jgi:hypothetical protein